MNLNDYASDKPFVFLAREGQKHILALSGHVDTPDTLEELSRHWDEHPITVGDQQVSAFFLLPFCQVAERGYVTAFREEKILLLHPERGEAVPTAEFIDALPAAGNLHSTEKGFDIDDKAYAEKVRKVIQDEIANGEGANFVIARSYEGIIDDFDHDKALRIFRNLLENEHGTYWIYLFYTGENYIIGATPERHICVYGKEVLMNPISGTLRKSDFNDAESARAGLIEFLRDPKEIFELFMVVDEEMKMMSQICSEGGQILGPYIKEMGRLAHTEYLLAGRTNKRPEEILRHSMFAPTVTGSPLENACRIIARYETRSRGYYSGIAGLKTTSLKGVNCLDSSIVIRTVDIAGDGSYRLTAGATLVRDSIPEAETAETTAKISGVEAALNGKAKPPYLFGNLRLDKEIQRILSHRNEHLAKFWFERQSPKDDAVVDFFSFRRIVIMDNEDGFSEMQSHILRRLGALPKIVRWADFDIAKLTPDAIPVIGPGPGDPTLLSDPKIAKGHAVARALLDAERPFVAVCLGHQITASELGLKIVRKQDPSQGVQKIIDTPRGPQRVGFYNTFAAVAPSTPTAFEYDADPATGEIHAIRHPLFATVQYHPESILSENGAFLYAQLFQGLEVRL